VLYSISKVFKITKLPIFCKLKNLKKKGKTKWGWNYCEAKYKGEDLDPKCKDIVSSYAYKLDKTTDTCSSLAITDEGKTDTAGAEIKNDSN
jgi:hypothetical protein